CARVRWVKTGGYFDLW
nr:immunoglobulin heavy chain junction region [Macaca mulatta]MOV38620.1 immunoglobulin heavy chain junction region [Macaca mulatta]MOV39192.1 immunoglobulin heavy chain junction region [Macaca mulatta]MOV40885.1 immunoglobulin heavy chain junction region [Macaca mulatta]MOV41260.1 immunoglobulin heavy chain junction region [Macaca mulatta]